MSTLQQAEQALAALDPCPFLVPMGPLAPVIEGAVSAMDKRDWLVTGFRERISATLRGCPPERLVDLRAGARPYKLAPTSGAPGTRALHAVGLALASKTPTLCLLGAASAASGHFYEALNAAALTGAPVVFVVIDHTPRQGAPIGQQTAGSAAAVAKAMGISASRVQATQKAVHAAVKKARKAGSPTLVQVHD